MTHRLFSLGIGLLTFLLLMFLSTAAFADPLADGAAQPGWLQQVADLVLTIVVPIVLLLASLAGRKLVKYFEAKTGVDIPEKQERSVDEWIEKGIHWAEERSRTAIKAGASKLPGSTKLDMVTDLVVGIVEARGWDDWTRDRIIAKIEGRLGQLRAVGAKPSLGAGE